MTRPTGPHEVEPRLLVDVTPGQRRAAALVAGDHLPDPDGRREVLTALGLVPAPGVVWRRK